MSEMLDWKRDIERRIEDLEEAIDPPEYPMLRASIGREGVMWTIKVTEREGEPAHSFVRRGDAVLVDQDVDSFEEGVEVAMAMVGQQVKSAKSAKGEGDGTA